MADIRVQDEQGNIHVFPDGSTPEMISKAMNVKAPDSQPAPQSSSPLWDAARAKGKTLTHDDWVNRQSNMTSPSEGPALIQNLAGYMDTGPGDVGRGVANLAQGNIAQGGHQVLSGIGTTLQPAAGFVPGATLARTVAGSYVGNKILSGGAQAMGANPDQAQFAGDIGSFAGGMAANSSPATSLMDLLSPKSLLKSKIQASAAAAAPAETGPSDKMIDVPNRSVQAGPNPPENLLPVPGKPMRGPQGTFEVVPPEGAVTGTAAGPIESEPAPVQTAQVAQPTNAPNRRVTMGDPAKAGDYTVAPIQQGGKEIGKIVYQVDGDRGIIHWVGDPQMENSLSSQLGPMGLKQLFLKFAQANPEVKTLEGIRVGGANGDAALSKSYNVSDLYAKTPPRSLLSAHERQLAGQNSRPPVTYNPAPGGPTVAPAVTTEPRVPVDYDDMSDLLVQSLKMLREGKK
jgi:hypothetical protein